MTREAEASANRAWMKEHMPGFYDVITELKRRGMFGRMIKLEKGE